MDKREAVTQAHAEFVDDRSDFLSYLSIWKWFEEALVHKKSNRKLVQDCHDRFLSYLRLREWRELHSQLHALVAEMGWRLNEKEARYEEIHRALLAGLLGNIGFKSDEAGIYLGARQIKFVLSPASGLKKKGPKWVMAAELTETTRLYARCVAAIEPEWIERLGGHLAKRSYREPHWSKDSGSVVAYEQVSVYGLVVVPKRRVQYGPIEPKEARELFIRGALVAGHYPGQRGIPRAQPPPDRGCAATRAQIAPPRRAGRRRGDFRVLRRAHSRGDLQFGGFRKMAQAGRA